MALQRHTAGRLGEAEALYRQILAAEPDHADALHLLGILAHQVGRSDAAADLIGRAISLKPGWAEAYSNRGEILRALGRLNEAIAAHRQAIALRPDHAESYYNLGVVLNENGQLDDAIAAYRQAIALGPHLPKAYNNLGAALSDKARWDQAIARKPHLPGADGSLHNGAAQSDLLDEAIAACRRAIALQPNYPEAYINIGVVSKETGNLDEAIAAYRQAIAVRPDSAEAHSGLVFAMHLHPAFDARALADELSRWNRRHAAPLREASPAGPGPARPACSDRAPRSSAVPPASGFRADHFVGRAPVRRLRIGYVSPDFADHVVGRNVLPLFRRHNRQEFEIFCYHNISRCDAITAEFQTHADHWRSIVGLSDEHVARLVREDRIDILVDLALHTAHNRLLVFARKPAPVQATFAGYPSSTGLTAIDYRLSDPYLDPPDSDQSINSERTIRLPETFWCYDPLENSGMRVSPLPALQTGGITFGCLNTFCKINPAVLSLWAQVLRRVENSRLLLLAPLGSHRQRTVDRLAQDGIDPGRVQFISRLSRRDYLHVYHRIDVAVDSFPYNGHTTSLDALWMGVPVVTLVGKTPVARAGWSQLSNLGLTELAGHTPEQFVEIAAALASDLPRLSELRGTLRQRMERSPLMDAPRFAAGIEAAYRQMHCGVLLH